MIITYDHRLDNIRLSRFEKVKKKAKEYPVWLFIAAILTITLILI
jgi:hypothetical protein